MHKRVLGMALVGSPVGRKTACVLLYRGLAEPSPPNLKTPSCEPGSSSRADLLSYACLYRFCPFGTLEGVPPQALSSFLVFVSFLCSFDEGFFFLNKLVYFFFFANEKCHLKKRECQDLKMQQQEAQLYSLLNCNWWRFHVCLGGLLRWKHPTSEKWRGTSEGLGEGERPKSRKLKLEDTTRVSQRHRA